MNLKETLTDAAQQVAFKFDQLNGWVETPVYRDRTGTVITITPHERPLSSPDQRRLGLTTIGRLTYRRQKNGFWIAD